jgi:Cu+-exporting ATPase
MTAQSTALPPQSPPSQRTELQITGMTCSSCTRRVERALQKLSGVHATVNFATEKATVQHPDSLTVDDLIDAVNQAGYSAAQPARADDTTDNATDEVLNDLRMRIQVCAVLALPIVAMAMIPALQIRYWQWASFVLATPIVIWGAEPFYRAAWANLRHYAASMDTLVSLGTVAAYGWSLYALFFGTAGIPGVTHTFHFTLTFDDGTSQIYLEVAATVITFVLLGRYAEARAKRRSGAALRALLSLAAKDAAVLRDGQEVHVPIDQLAVDDCVVIRPGEKIATDGEVEDGTSAVDTSMITGEPIPVDVGPGDVVIGGCINVSGRIVVRATRVGADTQLAQMAALVEQAQSRKAAIQRLADQISGQFVPVVILFSVMAGGFWLGTNVGPGAAISAAVAVLICACPCALGLATPTALLVGTGRGAQLGILITGPEVMESTRRVDTIVLDKTGTLTTGEMTVADVAIAPGEDLAEVLAVSGALESASQHPIAKAITRHAGEAIGQLPAVVDAVALDGLGMQGQVEGKEAVIGRASLLAQRGIAIPDELQVALDRAHGQGCSTAVVACSGRALAVLVVADTVRPTSRTAVAQFRKLGLEPILLTGDSAGAAHTVARQVGIDIVACDALPGDKVGIVRQLQDEGKVVAMVGDGVNDAAALAQADLGLAMGSGTDVAIHASDLTLVRADLLAAADAIRLSRRILAVIKGNLFWAFVYNYLALPVAAVGLLNPMLAGAAMSASSVFVVTNSLRLRRFRPTDSHQPPIAAAT